MSETFIFLLLAVISLLIGAFIGNHFARLKHKAQSGKLDERLAQLTQQEEKLREQFGKAIEEKESIRTEKEGLGIELAKRTSELQNLENKLTEQKNELEKLQERFTKEFENLANKILDEKSSKFAKQNKENLDQILNPLQEKIRSFEKKVEESHKESIDRHAMLRQQIIDLKGLSTSVIG